MKLRVPNISCRVIILTLVGTVGFLAFSGRADLEVSASVRVQATTEFEAPLADYGSWIDVHGYGRCWHPSRIAVEWRPYCYGHWVWTDCGWYWASDEPWGWACYHYGYWVDDPGFGWIWIPGIEWAPAWVSWRCGAGFIGWAPLTPRGVVIGASQFEFVAAARFTAPLSPHSFVANGATVFTQTTAINNLKRESRSVGGSIHQTVVVNKGPGLAPFDERTTGTIRMVPIQEAARQAAPPARFSSPAGRTAQNGKPAVAPAEPNRPQWGNGPSPGEHGEPVQSPPPKRQPVPHEDKAHNQEHEKGGKEHGGDML